MYQPDGYHLKAMTDSLGTAFRGEELSFKPYPCGRGLHASLDAALALYHTLELAPAAEGTDIAEVLVTTDAATYTEQFAPGKVAEGLFDHLSRNPIGMRFLKERCVNNIPLYPYQGLKR